MTLSQAVAGVLVSLMCLLGTTRPAQAHSARRFSLNLTRQRGAEACVTSLRMAAMVEQLLGPVFAAPADAELAIEVQLSSAEASGWDALVTVSDPAGQVLGRRELRVDDADCRALDRALLLIIAMAIDPEVGQRGLPAQLLSEFDDGQDHARELLEQLQAKSPEAPAASDLREAEAATEQPKSPVANHVAPMHAGPAAAAEPNVRLQLELSALGGRGLLPGWALGVGVGFVVELPRAWPLRLSAAYWPAGDLRPAPSELSAPTVAIAMAQASLASCPLRAFAPPFALHACAGLTVTHHWTERNSLDQPTRARSFAWGPWLGAQFGYDWSQVLGSRLGIDLYAPFSRDFFTYTETNDRMYPLFRPSALEVSAHLGIALRIEP